MGSGGQSLQSMCPNQISPEWFCLLTSRALMESIIADLGYPWFPLFRVMLSGRIIRLMCLGAVMAVMAERFVMRRRDLINMQIGTLI